MQSGENNGGTEATAERLNIKYRTFNRSAVAFSFFPVSPDCIRGYSPLTPPGLHPGRFPDCRVRSRVIGIVDGDANKDQSDISARVCPIYTFSGDT